MLSVITALEFFQHYFAKMGHRNTSCDPHLHQAIEQPMLPTSREASAAGRLRSSRLIGMWLSAPRRIGPHSDNPVYQAEPRPLFPFRTVNEREYNESC